MSKGLRRRDFILGAGVLGVSLSFGLGNAVTERAETDSPNVRPNIDVLSTNPVRLGALEAAIKEMQDRSAKDPNDPKGWLVNAKAHADYCSVPNVNDPSQIHFCWWFLPWHRAYLSITEQKLQALSGDKTISLPYWNWSSNRQIPAAFSRSGSPLAKAIRYTPNRQLIGSEVDADAKLRVGALEAKIFLATSPAEIGSSFGGIARPNLAEKYGNNRIEGVPHGPIHNYVGGENQQGNIGDMTDFETAGRDPIFFAHHGNLDRLWEIWRLDPKHKAEEPATEAFLKHEFPFTWLDGTIVTVSVEKVLDTRQLGYEYDSLNVLSQNFHATMAENLKGNPELPPVAVATVSMPKIPLALSNRPVRYGLEINGITPPERPMTIEVQVKPVGTVGKSGVTIGTFAAVRSGGRIVFPDTNLSFDMSEAMRRFPGSQFTVWLVPLTLGTNQRPYPPLAYKAIRIRITPVQ